MCLDFSCCYESDLLEVTYQGRMKRNVLLWYNLVTRVLPGGDDDIMLGLQGTANRCLRENEVSALKWQHPSLSNTSSKTTET